MYRYKERFFFLASVSFLYQIYQLPIRLLLLLDGKPGCGERGVSVESSEDAVLIFFFLFCHVNENTFPSPGILKVYFIMSIKRNYIEFYDGGEDFLFSSLETSIFFYSMELEVSGGTMWYFF